MATRYGEAAREYWEKRMVAWQARKKTIFIIVGVAIVMTVLINYCQG